MLCFMIGRARGGRERGSAVTQFMGTPGRKQITRKTPDFNFAVNSHSAGFLVPFYCCDKTPCPKAIYKRKRLIGLTVSEH